MALIFLPHSCVEQFYNPGRRGDHLMRSIFTQEELAAMRAADAEIEASFRLSPEERLASVCLEANGTGNKYFFLMDPRNQELAWSLLHLLPGALKLLAWTRPLISLRHEAWRARRVLLRSKRTGSV